MACCTATSSSSGCTVLESLLGGVGHDGLFKIVNELDGHTHRNVLRMLRAPASSWWVAQAGGFDAVVCAAAAGAARELVRRSRIAPGSAAAATRSSPVGFRAGHFLDPVCLLRTGGDTNTPAQVKPKSFHDLTASSTHVSARFVCDCADLAHGSYIITPLGNCEVAGSPFLGQPRTRMERRQLLAPHGIWMRSARTRSFE